MNKYNYMIHIHNYMNITGWRKLAKAIALIGLSEITRVEGPDAGRRAADE